MTTIEEQMKKHEKLVYFMVNEMFKGTEYLDYSVQTRGFEREDVYHVGKIGLWKALKSFDELKGIKFSSYATRCIRNEILNEIVNRIPIKGTPRHLDMGTRMRMAITKDIDDVKMQKYERSNSFEDDTIHNMLFRDNSEGLTERELKVIKMRMDLYSFTDIGKELGCSRQNVNVILARVQRKLGKLKRELVGWN